MGDPDLIGVEMRRDGFAPALLALRAVFHGGIADEEQRGLIRRRGVNGPDGAEQQRGDGGKQELHVRERSIPGSRWQKEIPGPILPWRER